MTALLAVGCGLLGVGVGLLLNRAAAGFPWQRSGRRPADAPVSVGASPPQLHERARAAVRPPLVEIGTGLLFALTAWQFGATWELPAFLFFAGAGVLLTVIDVQHRLLPNRVVLPSLGIGAALLTVAAAGEGAWPSLLRAGVASAVLFVVFLVLALISPRSLGMGDVKLAALIGLFLGWLGWGTVVVGAAAGFVVQAVLALVLLAGRRIGLRGELPFGPAMLLGAALAIGWSDLFLP